MESSSSCYVAGFEHVEEDYNFASFGDVGACQADDFVAELDGEIIITCWWHSVFCDAREPWFIDTMYKAMLEF